MLTSVSKKIERIKRVETKYKAIGRLIQFKVRENQNTTDVREEIGLICSFI